jgi:uncharacterized Zn-finger protein
LLHLNCNVNPINPRYFAISDFAAISWDILGQLNTTARETVGASTTEPGAGDFSNKGFCCTQCLKVYRHRSNLLRHIRLECGKEPIFHCPYCQHRSKRKGNLMMHIRNLHQKDAEKLTTLYN